MYLEPAPGEAGMNILKMAREGLRRELTTALHKAVASRDPVRHPGLRVKTNGDFTLVNLTVRPVTAGPDAATESALFLVIFEESPPAAQQRPEKAIAVDAVQGADASATDVDARIAALKQELRAKEEYLQTTNEELETSNEELKSSNEEMQSVNEELQSTNEELETSKEELQSVNEELATVNAELQTQGGRSVAGQQRHEQPAGRHGHRHRLRGPSTAHPALHPRRHPGDQPDPDRRGAAGGAHRLQPGGL